MDDPIIVGLVINGLLTIATLIATVFRKVRIRSACCKRCLRCSTSPAPSPPVSPRLPEDAPKPPAEVEEKPADDITTEV